MAKDDADNKANKSWALSGTLKRTFMGLAGCFVAHTIITTAGLWWVSETMSKGLTMAFNMAVDGQNPLNVISPTLG